MVSKELKDEFLDAAVNNHTRALELLKEHPSLREGLYLHEETALHFLAVEGYLEAVRVLGANGFDPNSRNSVNTTSLEDVLSLGNYSIVRSLLECGADPNASSDTSGCVLGTAM